MWFLYVVCLNKEICTAYHFTDCTESELGHVFS